MIAPEKPNLVRASLTLDPADVDLLDRLAALEGKNRSYELRSILTAARPMLTATVQALENAQAQRDRLNAAVASGAIGDLERLMPEVEKINAAYVGALSRLEGAAAAAEAADPRASNHGGHTPTPTPQSHPSDRGE